MNAYRINVDYQELEETTPPILRDKCRIETIIAETFEDALQISKEFMIDEELDSLNLNNAGVL